MPGENTFDVPDDVRVAMREFLDERDIGYWWVSQIPALGFLTPLEAWIQSPERVWQLIDAYRTGAFL